PFSTTMSVSTTSVAVTTPPPLTTTSAAPAPTGAAPSPSPAGGDSRSAWGGGDRGKSNAFGAAWSGRGRVARPTTPPPPLDPLALGADDARAADQLHTVLHARLGHTDDEAEIGIRARAHAQLIEVEGQRRDRRVVADQDQLGALQREAAIALRVATVLTDGDA